MRRLSDEDKAGIYTTVIVHLAVVIVLLLAGLDYSLKRENSFVLDFSKLEEMERLQEEVERLQKEAEFKESISRKLQEQLASTPASAIRGVAVDLGALRDDRGTDAEQLYKDAERLQQELASGYQVEQEDVADPGPVVPEKQAEQKDAPVYSGPSVVSYYLEGRKASKLPIPAYRCMGAGQVTVLITVNPSGAVIAAKVDESVSSTDGCLRAFAIRAARLSKFSAKADAAPKQQGNIVYEFIAQ